MIGNIGELQRTEVGYKSWAPRIVGEGTTPNKVRPGDLVIPFKPDSSTGWSTPAIIRHVAKNGVLFLQESFFILNTLVLISRRDVKRHKK